MYKVHRLIRIEKLWVLCIGYLGIGLCVVQTMIHLSLSLEVDVVFLFCVMYNFSLHSINRFAYLVLVGH